MRSVRCTGPPLVFVVITLAVICVMPMRSAQAVSWWGPAKAAHPLPWYGPAKAQASVTFGSIQGSLAPTTSITSVGHITSGSEITGSMMADLAWSKPTAETVTLAPHQERGNLGPCQIHDLIAPMAENDNFGQLKTAAEGEGRFTDTAVYQVAESNLGAKLPDYSII